MWQSAHKSIIGSHPTSERLAGDQPLSLSANIINCLARCQDTTSLYMCTVQLQFTPMSNTDRPIIRTLFFGTLTVI